MTEPCADCGHDHSPEATIAKHVSVGTLAEFLHEDGGMAYELTISGLGLLEELLGFAIVELAPREENSLVEIQQLSVINHAIREARSYVLDYMDVRLGLDTPEETIINV